MYGCSAETSRYAFPQQLNRELAGAILTFIPTAPFFTALTVLSVLLVPTLGRAGINIDKVMWIAENGIGVGVGYTLSKTYIT